MYSRAFEVNTVFSKKQVERRFCDNKVNTAKYNCVTFLPMNLFEQFSKMANFYFLIMTGVQLIPIDDLYNLYFAATTFMPVVFVVTISMIKDLIEDHGRKKADKKENDQMVEAVPRGGTEWTNIQSKKLQVGCIVKVKQDQFFPADILLLQTSLPKGICYVETKNLDGETNRK